MKLKNETYDLLKILTTRVIPGIATLYFALSQIWGLPYGEEIVGSLAAITTFLGTVLGISSKNYNPIDDADLKG